MLVVPRAKANSYYSKKQLLFKSTVKSVAVSLKEKGFVDGTDYIKRHTNTLTTHLRNNILPKDINDVRSPYPGITRNTCNISNYIKGRNILLIDDIYTKTVDIDEDCIQALLDEGAKKVIFYAIAKTAYRKEGNI